MNRAGVISQQGALFAGMRMDQEPEREDIATATLRHVRQFFR